MKFSSSQENGYGVGLRKELSLHEVLGESTMMESPINAQSKSKGTAEVGPLVSNLPLLFADGYPTSLEKITLVQLERFIAFMVQCSLGHDTTSVITEPQWWPKEIKFSNPLARPKKIPESWTSNLKKLVFRCYTYHRSEYLLRFCSYLARYPQDELEYINNWDSTTSLFHKSTGKLLVTFRNENMNYDKRTESPRKTLLSHNGAASGHPNKAKQQLHSLIMVEPPSEDIYLCDNCDAEFIGLEKMKEHERTCCEQEQGSSNSRPSTPDLSVPVESELRQNQFLEYFQLSSANTETKTVEEKTGSSVAPNADRRNPRRVRGGIHFTRSATIPFSSPAGILLAKKSKAMTEETQQERLERIERHLVAPPLSGLEGCRPKWFDGGGERDRWVVTHKPSRDKPTNDYVHQYRFVNSVKRKTMLSIQSQLLYIVCRPVYVLLTRLTQEQIDELKPDPSKNWCPIRKISVNRKEPARGIKVKVRPSVSSKRKAPADESDDDVPVTGDALITAADTIPKATLVPSTAEKAEPLSTDIINKTVINDVLKEETKCCAPLATESSGTITLIDLCSSDEEEDPRSTAGSTDENSDPRNPNDAALTNSLCPNHTPSKLCPKPCIYRADSTSDWLSENNLTDDAGNCTKYRNTVILNACANLPPILSPTP